MMRAFFTAMMTLLALQVFATPTPEDMYGQYDKDGKYRDMQEQVDQMNQKVAEAEQVKAEKQSMALWFSILIGLIPLGYIGKQVVSGRTWQNDPGGTVRALAIGLAGGALLFALNYGIFLLKIKYGSQFNSVLAAALVLFLVIGSIYVLRKKK